MTLPPAQAQTHSFHATPDGGAAAPRRPSPAPRRATPGGPACFPARCACGGRLAVEAGAARGDVPCPCGRSAGVPTASAAVHARLSRALLAEGARRRGPAWGRAAEAVRRLAPLAAAGLAVVVLVLLALLGLHALSDALARPPRGVG